MLRRDDVPLLLAARDERDASRPVRVVEDALDALDERLAAVLAAAHPVDHAEPPLVAARPLVVPYATCDRRHQSHSPTHAVPRLDAHILHCFRRIRRPRPLYAKLYYQTVNMSIYNNNNNNNRPNGSF